MNSCARPHATHTPQRRPQHVGLRERVPRICRRLAAAGAARCGRLGAGAGGAGALPQAQQVRDASDRALAARHARFTAPKLRADDADAARALLCVHCSAWQHRACHTCCSVTTVSAGPPGLPVCSWCGKNFTGSWPRVAPPCAQDHRRHRKPHAQHHRQRHQQRHAVGQHPDPGRALRNRHQPPGRHRRRRRRAAGRRGGQRGARPCVLRNPAGPLLAAHGGLVLAGLLGRRTRRHVAGRPMGRWQGVARVCPLFRGKHGSGALGLNASQKVALSSLPGSWPPVHLPFCFPRRTPLARSGSSAACRACRWTCA